MQHPKVGEETVAEFVDGPGDSHRIGEYYARKTPINGAVFLFAVALLSFGACGPRQLQQMCMWAFEVRPTGREGCKL